jgi:hypothetical protein
MLSIIFFPRKSCRCEVTCEECYRVGQATCDYNAAHALCILDTEVYKRTLRLYRMRKTSMLKLRELIEGIKTKIYCQATLWRTCFLAVPGAIIVGLTKVGNQTKPPEVL